MCQHEFKSIEKQNFTKRIFLFTDYDEASSSQDKLLAEKRAQDLEALDVDIELFSLPVYDQMTPTFDIRKFYSSLITFDENDIPSSLLNLEES